MLCDHSMRLRSIVKLIGVSLSGLLVDSWGRRPLLMWGAAAQVRTDPQLYCVACGCCVCGLCGFSTATVRPLL